MTYCITQSEIKRRKILPVKCFIIGIAPVCVPLAVISFLQKNVGLLFVVFLAVTIIGYAVVQASKKWVRAIIENPLVVSEEGVVFPCSRSGIAIAHAPWESVISLRVKNRDPLSFILRCRGVSKVKVIGYENMDRLFQEMLCHIPREKVKETKA